MYALDVHGESSADRLIAALISLGVWPRSGARILALDAGESVVSRLRALGLEPATSPAPDNKFDVVFTTKQLPVEAEAVATAPFETAARHLCADGVALFLFARDPDDAAHKRRVDDLYRYAYPSFGEIRFDEIAWAIDPQPEPTSGLWGLLFGKKEPPIAQLPELAVLLCGAPKVATEPGGRIRRQHIGGYNLADNIAQTLALSGHWPNETDKVLDFGCGAGGLTYALRDLGFDGWGFDIHERVEYRDRSDRSFFGFFENPETNTANAVVKNFRLPFDDNQFDCVVSTSVIEHVIDLPGVMREIARVLKPDGVAMHVYPRKDILVEPHVYVPLGGLIQIWPWLYFWALKGVRNEFQEELNAAQTVSRNRFYFRTGLSYRYLSQPRLHRLAGAYFRSVRNVDGHYYHRQPRWDFKASMKVAKTDPHPYRAFSLQQRLAVLLTAEKA
jgi:SAM-dependent methyltransferase